MFNNFQGKKLYYDKRGDTSYILIKTVPFWYFSIQKEAFLISLTSCVAGELLTHLQFVILESALSIVYITIIYSLCPYKKRKLVFLIWTSQMYIHFTKAKPCLFVSFVFSWDDNITHWWDLCVIFRFTINLHFLVLEKEKKRKKEEAN